MHSSGLAGVGTQGVGRGDFKESPNTGLDSGSLRPPFAEVSSFKIPTCALFPVVKLLSILQNLCLIIESQHSKDVLCCLTRQSVPEILRGRSKTKHSKIGCLVP